MHRARRSNYFARGFTLVEIIVSVGIGLLLILGVNQVFRVSSQATGAGQALLTSLRDARTIEQTLQADFKDIVPVYSTIAPTGSAPAFIIQSQHVYAFRNFADAQSATNPTDPSTDTNLFTAFPGNQIPVTMTHFRSHRVDKLAFFARDLFARQTSSDDTSYVSTITGSEAWIVYGHGAIPNNSYISAAYGGATSNNAPLFFGPGDQDTSGTNDNNKFASDWMLTRFATILNPTPTEANYITYGGSSSNLGLDPLAGASMDVSKTYPLSTARYDLASTSMSLYGGRISALYGPPQNSGVTNQYGKIAWWDPLISYRYQICPTIVPKAGGSKVSSFGLARTAPCLIRGCSQFIVEYAGSYYSKDASGNADPNLNKKVLTNSDGSTSTIHQPVPDGQVDFYIDGNGNRQIRWYGYPRDTNGDGVIDMHDVLPLRDVIAAVTPPGLSGAANGLLKSEVDYWRTYPDAELGPDSNAFGKANRLAGFPSGPYTTTMIPSTDRNTPYTYTAAWGPDTTMPFPMMLRITIGIDDPTGRLNQPQLYEYVFNVQP